MVVKVVSMEREDVWYSHLIGKEFEVEDNCFKMSNGKNLVIVKQDDIRYEVLAEDVEVIKCDIKNEQENSIDFGEITIPITINGNTYNAKINLVGTINIL